MKNSSTIEAMILPTVEGLGYELWGCVYLTQGQRNTLRVYIDSVQGIGLVDCERVSRQLSALFDVEDPILTRYDLEVSSPGMNRPLFTIKQFQRFIGYEVAIQTHVAINGQRNFKGLIKLTNEKGLILNSENKDLELAWDNILRANVLPEIIK